MRQEAGFTLIETIVALAVFALAATALLNVQGLNARMMQTGEEKTLAAIIAENQLVLMASDPLPPQLGVTKGEVEAAGRNWRWVQNVTAAPGGALLRVDITVTCCGSPQALSILTAFREAQS